MLPWHTHIYTSAYPLAISWHTNFTSSSSSSIRSVLHLSSSNDTRTERTHAAKSQSGSTKLHFANRETKHVSPTRVFKVTSSFYFAQDNSAKIASIQPIATSFVSKLHKCGHRWTTVFSGGIKTWVCPFSVRAFSYIIVLEKVEEGSKLVIFHDEQQFGRSPCVPRTGLEEANDVFVSVWEVEGVLPSGSGGLAHIELFHGILLVPPSRSVPISQFPVRNLSAIIANWVRRTGSCKKGVAKCPLQTCTVANGFSANRDAAKKVYTQGNKWWA